MDPISLGIAGAGLAAQVIGGFISSGEEKKQRRAEAARAAAIFKSQEELRGISLEQEGLRRETLKRDAQRARIKAIREGIIQRSQNVAGAAASGSRFSSGFKGAQSAIGSQVGQQVGDISAAELQGEEFFDLNEEKSVVQGRLNNLGQPLQQGSNTGQFISSLGGALIKNSGTIGQIGQSIRANVPNIGNAAPNSIFNPIGIR